MKQNENQINDVRKLAKKLRVKLVLKSIGKFGMDFKINKWLPKNKEYSRYSEGKPKLKSRTCPNIFDSLVILSNGDVVLCCGDFDGKYVAGNVFKEKLADIFRGKKYMKLRQDYFKNNLEICRLCDVNIKGEDYSIVEDYTN